jgi:hypothetical protein
MASLLRHCTTIDGKDLSHTPGRASPGLWGYLVARIYG